MTNKINRSELFSIAWKKFKSEGNVLSFSVCLTLAWAEIRGSKKYTFNLESSRASITSYIMKLNEQIKAAGSDVSEHDIHKHDILMEALLHKTDKQGVAVMEGKMIGLCKYAVRNA